MAILFAAGIFLALVGLPACNGATGGAEAGNPNRTVIGSLSSPGAAALSLSSASGCAADHVIATNSRGQSSSSAVAADCSFELTLHAPEAYRLDFTTSGQTTASMQFNNSSKRFLSPVMNLSPGDNTIFLDRVTLKNGVATPSSEPAAQNDQDRDGIPDLSDDDDDNDGILNEDEPDCDLDGIIDDFDQDTTTCTPGPQLVLEVTPRNGEGLETHGAKVKINDVIRLRFACPVDVTKLLVSNLEIFPEGDAKNLLVCAFGTTGSGKQVQCDHPDLLSDTIYHAHMEGVHCEDGTDVPAVTWEWKTE